MLNILIKKVNRIICELLIPLVKIYIRHWPIQKGKIFLFKWFFWRGRTLTCKTKFGVKMKGRTNDLVQGYIYYFGIWEPNLTHFIRNRLQANRTFIDIGANVGYFSLLAASQMRSGRVVSIEALPRIYNRLIENITLNKYRNIRTVNVAATDVPSSICMYYGNLGNEGGSTSLEGKYESKGEMVKGLPLSDILSDSEIKTARLIKIDTEGAEYSVIRGMNAILDQLPEDVEIVVEINPEILTKDEILYIFNSFESAGFLPYILKNLYAPENYLSPFKEEYPVRMKNNLEKITDVIFSKMDSAVL